MNSIRLLTASALIALSLAGCHGGGGVSIRSEAANGGTKTTSDSVIPDKVTNDPASGGNSPGTLNGSDNKESPLKSEPIDTGTNAADMGKTAKPSIIEATGSYTSAATGQPKTIAADAPMREALASDSGTMRVAVKSATESAVQKAGPAATSTIEASNNLNGSTSATFILDIEGIIAANAIKGLQFEIIIPDGITVRSNAASGATLPGIVAASSSIADAQPLIFSTFSASSSLLAIGLLTNTGIGSGDLAIFTCDIPSGWAIPSPTAFSVRNIKAVDNNGATISGVKVTVN